MNQAKVCDLFETRNPMIIIISILSIEHVSIGTSRCSAHQAMTSAMRIRCAESILPEVWMCVCVCHVCDNRITKERKWMKNCQQVIDLVARYRIQWTRHTHTHTRQKKKIMAEHRISVANIDDDDDGDDEYHVVRIMSTCSSFSRWFANSIHSMPAPSQLFHVVHFALFECETNKIQKSWRNIQSADTRLMLLYFLFRASSIVQTRFLYLRKRFYFLVLLCVRVCSVFLVGCDWFA